MDYSTDVTSRLVKMVLEDTVKVVVDHDMAPEYEQKDIDTGLFSCIHRGKGRISNESNPFKLEICGKQIKDKNLKKY